MEVSHGSHSPFSVLYIRLVPKLLPKIEKHSAGRIFGQTRFGPYQIICLNSVPRFLYFVHGLSPFFQVGTANLAKIFEVQCNEPAVAINKKSKLVNSVITFQLYGQYAAVKVNATVGPVTVVDGKAAFSVNTATVCYVSGL